MNRPKTMNKEEQHACQRLYARAKASDKDNKLTSYRAFRRRVFYSIAGCWIVPNCMGMVIGIERDGYTHS